MLFSVFTATFLPARSFGLLMALPDGTRMPAKSFAGSAVAWLPDATTLTGRPLSVARSSEVTLLNPNWY